MKSFVKTNTHSYNLKIADMANNSANGRSRPPQRTQFARVITKRMAQIVFNVKQHHIRERDSQRRSDLNQIVPRTMEATGVGRSIVCKLKTQPDVNN